MLRPWAPMTVNIIGWLINVATRYRRSSHKWRNGMISTHTRSSARSLPQVTAYGADALDRGGANYPYVVAPQDSSWVSWRISQFRAQARFFGLLW